MRRIISFAALLFGSIGAFVAGAQTPTPIPITGNLGSISGSGLPYSGVLIQLQNCPSPVTITGYWGIAAQTYQLQANSAGAINSTIWPNDLITCNGTTGASQYSYQTVVGGVPSGSVTCYQVTSTQGIWNINTQQPITCGYTPPNPQDASYRNITSSGYLSGVNGAMSGTWSASSLTATGQSANSGKCVQWGTGGILTAASSACGSGSTSGVTQLIAGSNITLSPSSGTGAVTVTANNSSVGPGTLGQLAYFNNTNTISSTAYCSISQGCTGAQTASAALSNLGGAPYGGTGIQFNVNTTSGRTATASDITSLLGYTPLIPTSNLSDVSSAKTSLKNLFGLSGLLSSQMLATDSVGNPINVIAGPGISYTASVGYGSVTSVSVTTIGTYSTCPSLVISGGGGSGATASAVCNTLTSGASWRVVGATVTSGGSGYTSAPSVVTSPSGGAILSATIGSSAEITSSWQSGTLYSVIGTTIPACSSTYLLQRLAVSDAQSATPGTAYVGSGTYTIPVECVYNASGGVYTWIID